MNYHKNSEHGSTTQIHAARSPELDVGTNDTTDAAQVPTDREVPTPVGGEEEEGGQHTAQTQTQTAQVLPTSQTEGAVGVACGRS